MSASRISTVTTSSARIGARLHGDPDRARHSCRSGRVVHAIAIATYAKFSACPCGRAWWWLAHHGADGGGSAMQQGGSPIKIVMIRSGNLGGSGVQLPVGDRRCLPNDDVDMVFSRRQKGESGRRSIIGCGSARTVVRRSEANRLACLVADPPTSESVVSSVPRDPCPPPPRRRRQLLTVR